MNATKRTVMLVSMLLLALLWVPAPASADFHGVCTGFATAYANVGLQADLEGDALTYSGIVNCPDSVVTIQSLRLAKMDASYGYPVVSEIEGDPCPATLTGPCTLANLTAAGPGTYRVLMTFDVDDPATAHVDFQGVERMGGFLWSGTGQPVPHCASVGFFPVSAGC